MGIQLLSPKQGQSPQFSAHFYCWQTAGCIKMPLGMEVGLSPGDFMLDGDPCPCQQRGGASPIFGPLLLRPNCCTDQDATWYGGRLRPTRHCVRWGPSSPLLKGHSPPNFRPMSVVAKRLDGLMALGMEVGLGRDDFVFDGDPATRRKEGTPTPPNFWPISIVGKRLDG